MLLRSSYLSLSAGVSLRMESREARWVTSLCWSTNTSYRSVLDCRMRSEVPAERGVKDGTSEGGRVSE